MITPDEAQAIVARGFADPAFFLRTFFPSWFPLPMPWFHRGILAILTKKTDWLLNFGEESWPGGTTVWSEQHLNKILHHFLWREEPEDFRSPFIPLFQVERDRKGTPQRLNLSLSDRMLIIGPRGISKTTLVNAHVIQTALYREAKFIVYLSEAATHSELQLDNVKREFEQNALLQGIFGNKVPDRADSEHWGIGFVETLDGVAIAARGRGGQVRGLNHRGNRPDTIIFDDVEDKESVRTKEQRIKALTWLKSDVEPALPQVKSAGRIIGLGTIIHPESMLVTLSRDPEWITVKVGAIDLDGEMLWDHYMTKAEWTRRRRSFVRHGQLAEFNLEYMSTTKVDGEGAKFPRTFIYSPEEHLSFPARAMAMDPAISDSKDSDFSAFGVVGMTEKGKIHVLDIFMERGMGPREQIDKFFELHFKWQCNRHGIESIGYQRALIHLMQEEMFRRGKSMGPSSYFEILPIQHGKTSKQERVEGVLSPRYAAGYITHQRSFPEYEEQLLGWPHEKKDGPDVVAMAVTLLDPYAAWAYDPESEDEEKLERDIFEPLEVHYGAP